MAFFLRRIPIAGGLIAGVLAILMNARGLIEDKITPVIIRSDNASVFMTLCTGPKG